MMAIGVDLAAGRDSCVVCEFGRDAAGAMRMVIIRELRPRTVSARRARALRRAGVRCSPAGRTSTGKARYTYMASAAAAARWFNYYRRAFTKS